MKHDSTFYKARAKFIYEWAISHCPSQKFRSADVPGYLNNRENKEAREMLIEWGLMKSSTCSSGWRYYRVIEMGPTLEEAIAAAKGKNGNWRGCKVYRVDDLTA